MIQREFGEKTRVKCFQAPMKLPHSPIPVYGISLNADNHGKYLLYTNTVKYHNDQVM